MSRTSTWGLKLPLRSEKAGRSEKLLGFARSYFIMTRGSVSLSRATITRLPAFLNLKGIIFSSTLDLKYESYCMGRLCKLRHREKIREDIWKFISQEWHKSTFIWYAFCLYFNLLLKWQIVIIIFSSSKYDFWENRNYEFFKWPILNHWADFILLFKSRLRAGKMN